MYSLALHYTDQSLCYVDFDIRQNFYAVFNLEDLFHTIYPKWIFFCTRHWPY